ncbi:hypothetical protein D3C73_1209530 [compost metagenome]
MWQWPAANMRYSCAAQRSDAVLARRDRWLLTVVRVGSGRAPVEISPSMSSSGAGAATVSGTRRPLSYSIQAPSPRTASALSRLTGS